MECFQRTDIDLTRIECVTELRLAGTLKARVLENNGWSNLATIGTVTFCTHQEK